MPRAKRLDTEATRLTQCAGKRFTKTELVKIAESMYNLERAELKKLDKATICSILFSKEHPQKPEKYSRNCGIRKMEDNFYKDELVDIAQRLGIPYASQMKKEKLCEALFAIVPKMAKIEEKVEQMASSPCNSDYDKDECENVMENGLRRCRINFTSKKCEDLPEEYRKRATEGFGGDVKYKKYQAPERKSLRELRDMFENMQSGAKKSEQNKPGKISKYLLKKFEQQLKI
jgi:hypothetical protein